MESMSKAPYLLPQARFGYRMGDAKMLDAMVHDGLTNPFSGKQMFVEATEVGDELEMTRADLDRWALRSHELALKAIDEGRLAEEIVPVTVNGRKQATRSSRSTRVRAATPRSRSSPRCPASSARRARTRPATRRASTTAPARWCSPPRSGRRPTARRRSAEIVAHAQSANDFAYLATTPASAAKKALEKAGLQPGDIDLWEINEAFASVTLNSIRMLGIDEDKVNVNGGAVALGHPIGASGARILGSLVLELRRRGGGLGCAAICSGGGQGDAVILQGLVTERRQRRRRLAGGSAARRPRSSTSTRPSWRAPRGSSSPAPPTRRA